MNLIFYCFESQNKSYEKEKKVWSSMLKCQSVPQSGYGIEYNGNLMISKTISNWWQFLFLGGRMEK